MNHLFDEHLDALDTRVVECGGIAVIELAGEVDMVTAPEPLATALDVLERAPAGLALDLLAVSFFGSSGINLLLTVQEQAEHEGVPVGVVADKPVVLRPLAVTGVDTRLALFASQSEALRALNAMPARRWGRRTTWR